MGSSRRSLPYFLRIQTFPIKSSPPETVNEIRASEVNQSLRSTLCRNTFYRGNKREASKHGCCVARMHGINIALDSRSWNSER